MGHDSQLAQHGQDRRRHEAVALELDDDNVAHKTVVAGDDVVEAEVQVNGQTLGLALVDQGDAVEAVLQLRQHRGCIVVQGLAEEVSILSAAEVDGRQTAGGEVVKADALLLGTSVVVLGLHLKVIQMRVHVRADAQLLPVGVASLVYMVHLAVGGIKV